MNVLTLSPVVSKLLRLHPTCDVLDNNYSLIPKKILADAIFTLKSTLE